MAMKVKIVFKKTTAQYHRYEKDENDPAPVILNAYIHRDAIEGKPRKSYTVIIQEDEATA